MSRTTRRGFLQTLVGLPVVGLLVPKMHKKEECRNHQLEFNTQICTRCGRTALEIMQQPGPAVTTFTAGAGTWYSIQDDGRWLDLGDVTHIAVTRTKN